MIQLIPASQQQEMDDERLREIYEHSFPADERREWDQLKQLLGHPLFKLYKILKNNAISGIITIWRWPEFTFIEHFAIQESLRSQGIGKGVLQQIIHEKPLKIIVEVEVPHNESAFKRIAFYKLMGFYDCEQEYYQPPYIKGYNKVKMLLFSYPQQLTQQEFASIKSRLYKEVYGWDKFNDFP